MNQSLLETICNNSNLPTLPAVALKVLELSRSNNTSAAEVAKVIGNDPALSGKVLRTVNSPFYGMTHTVSSIQNAVAILGLQSLKTLVLGFSLVSMMKSNKTSDRSFDHLIYWRRTLYSATAARMLAERVKHEDPDSCFIAALLMDIGMLVMERALGERYADVVSGTQSHGDLMDVEFEAFDLSHDQVAGTLAQRWNLPTTLGVPMGYHHHIDMIDRPDETAIAKIIALAARCADVFVDVEPMWAIAEVRRMGSEWHNLGEDDCDELLDKVGRESRELAPLFEVRLDASADYKSILTRANEALLNVTKVSEPTAREATDRRRAPRITKNKLVSLLPCGGDRVKQSIMVTMQDVSARGLGFRHELPMTKGAQFIFKIPRMNAAPKTLLYSVMRCTPHPQGGFSIGAELDCIVKDDAQAA